ncbi:MAG: rhomboid family intramembrane serine protease [Mycobacteriaceae bacterium]|nr:rhomboid family intramembrane serine protease [Mycobacteriaceae bacterium]
MSIPDSAPARRRFALEWKPAALITLGFVALLYGVEAINAADHQQLNADGIRPRDTDGLIGILWAPVLHADWEHLAGNTVPALVLGFLTLLSGIARGLAVSAIIWAVAGVGTWLTAQSGTVHIGASSLIFGWLTYLLTRGAFSRNVGQILLGLVLLFLYGSVLWGVLPGTPGISWQGHLFGAIGGIVAAALLARRAAASPV